MNVFDRITKSPQALADFLQAIPAINAPWDDAFHRIYCDQCAAETATTARMKPFGVARFGI